MILQLVGFKFKLNADESLMKLVKDCGYSKPTKEDPIARREVFDFGEGSGEDINPVIEVHRKSKDEVFVTLRPGDFAEHVPGLVCTVWSDLEKAGLV